MRLRTCLSPLPLPLQVAVDPHCSLVVMIPTKNIKDTRPRSLTVFVPPDIYAHPTPVSNIIHDRGGRHPWEPRLPSRVGTLTTLLPTRRHAGRPWVNPDLPRDRDSEHGARREAVCAHEHKSVVARVYCGGPKLPEPQELDIELDYRKRPTADGNEPIMIQCTMAQVSGWGKYLDS